MKLPVLLDSRPPAVQLVLLLVPALLLGTVAGIALDLAAGAYYAVLIVAALGGIAAGVEHETAGQGAQRGLTGGLMFGLGVLVGHHLLNRRAQASLPHPEAVEVIVTSIFSVPLGAIGGAIRAHREDTAGRAQSPLA